MFRITSKYRNLKFDKVLDNVEDIEDIFEYAQEILDIKNETTQR